MNRIKQEKNQVEGRVVTPAFWPEKHTHTQKYKQTKKNEINKFKKLTVTITLVARETAEVGLGRPGFFPQIVPEWW